MYKLVFTIGLINFIIELAEISRDL